MYYHTINSIFYFANKSAFLFNIFVVVAAAASCIHSHTHTLNTWKLQSFHAELHRYKHQIELFSQLTQKLIKVYPTDDTSRIKRMTESVNLR